jgi:hypothetical protein
MERKAYQVNKSTNQFAYCLKFDYSIIASSKNEFSLKFEDSINWEELKYYSFFFNSGAAYFFDKFRKGFEVAIYNIRYMPVDTNYLLFMYGIIEALSDFFDFHIDGLTIEEGVFVFPK